MGFGFRPAGVRVPAGGWVSCRRFGVERKPSLGTKKNPMRTTKPMMTMSDLENYVVDRGFR